MGLLSMKKTGIAGFVKKLNQHARYFSLKTDTYEHNAGKDITTAAMLIERWGAAHVQIMNLLQQDYESEEALKLAMQVAQLLGARTTENGVEQ